MTAPTKDLSGIEQVADPEVLEGSAQGSLGLDPAGIFHAIQRFTELEEQCREKLELYSLAKRDLVEELLKDAGLLR